MRIILQAEQLSAGGRSPATAPPSSPPPKEPLPVAWMRGPDLPLRSQLRHPLRSASAATGFASPRSATAKALSPRAKYERTEGGPPFGGDPPVAHAHARGRGDGTLKWLVGAHGPHYTEAKYDRDDSLGVPPLGGSAEACAPSFARYQRHRPSSSARAARAWNSLNSHRLAGGESKERAACHTPVPP